MNKIAVFIMSIFLIFDGLAWGSAGLETIVLDLAPQELGLVTGPDSFVEFTGSNLQWLQQTGEPALPWRVITVLLPPQVRLETVKACFKRAHYRAFDGTWRVKPMAPEVTWHMDQKIIIWPDDRELIDGYDIRIYETDQFWPAADVRLLKTGRLRKFRLATVAYPLFRVNPVRDRLEKFESGSVQVRFATSTPLTDGMITYSELIDQIGTETVRRLVVNYEEGIQAYERTLSAVGRRIGRTHRAAMARARQGTGYVIITTTSIQSTSTELANFVIYKQSQGYTVQVITETDFGGGTGDTAAENIRSWLQANYVPENIEYVLLIGDPDPSSGGIPMKLTYPRAVSPLYWTPTDYYYVDLTGDWDLDDDGIYGEYNDDLGTGGVDRNWDVLVGRIPYYGIIADLDAILQRIVTYQSQAPQDIEWRKNALLAMAYIDDSIGSYNLGEDIKNDVLTDAEWSYYRIYHDPPVLDPPPDSSTCSRPICVGAWSSESYGLVVYWTHGSATSAADVINTSDVPSLNDMYPSFVFQASCLNAYPENTGNLSYELLQHGAINTIGGTRNYWSLQGDNIRGYATVEGMAYEYTTRIIPSGLSSGLALCELKQAIEPDYYTGALWMNYCDATIYGDPSTTLYIPELRVHNITQDTWYPTIKTAVDAAVNGEVIVLNQGVYRGIDNRDIDFAGKAITVRSEDPTNSQVVANTVVDLGHVLKYGFYFDSGEGADSVISGLTIVNGTRATVDCNLGSSPTISNCVFKYCTGSAINLSSSDSQIVDCTFTNNSADRGAGIYVGNGNPQIVRCIFTDNDADQGGAIYLTGSGNAEIRDCIISGNTATERGGGITSNYADLPLINCILTGNYALQYGGAVSVGFGNHVRPINSTFSRNRADIYGGGFYMFAADVSLDNCILSANTAPIGSEIYLADLSFYHPTAIIAYSDVEGGAASVDVENSNCTVVWDLCIDADPVFIDPGYWDDNGTPGDPSDDIWHQGDYHLSGSSPCIESGNNGVTGLPATDFEGDARIIDYDGDLTATIDMGADEAEVPPEYLIVTKGDADSDGVDDILLDWLPATTDTFTITYTTSLELPFTPLFADVTLPVYHVDALTDGNDYYFLAERSTP